MSKLDSILVIGDGQLGKSLESIAQYYDEYRFEFVNRNDLDLEDELSFSNFFKNRRFEVIINCAAYTSVDKAETEKELANKINHIAVKNLALITKKNRSKLIHISTDYVFDGTKSEPYLESDKVNPQGVYGKTKLQGEKAVIELLATGAIIIRTSWLYSEYGNNFVKTMMRLGKIQKDINIVCDQVGSPTYARDLAKTIMKIIQSNFFKDSEFKTQIYHFSNDGYVSWHDFAKAIFELTGIDCYAKQIETKDYPTDALRPLYSVLSNKKIRAKFNLNIPYWKDGLEECLMKLDAKGL